MSIFAISKRPLLDFLGSRRTGERRGHSAGSQGDRLNGRVGRHGGRELFPDARARVAVDKINKADLYRKLAPVGRSEKSIEWPSCTISWIASSGPQLPRLLDGRQPRSASIRRS